MKRLTPAIVFLIATGCGRPTPLGEVEGTVSLAGKPLDRVKVGFLPDPDQKTRGPASFAITDAQGRFRIPARAGDAGVVVGHHRIVLSDLQSLGSRPPMVGKTRSAEKPKAAPTARVPRHYRDARSTPLRREIRAGSQSVDLAL